MIAQKLSTQTLTQLDLFIENLPAKPSCANDFGGGTVIRSIPHAILKRYIQYNRPGVVKWMIFDVDEAFRWTRANTAGLLMPAWIAWNRENRHAHVAYGLTAPVPLTTAAKMKPRRYLAAVQEAYRLRLRADPAFAHRMTKNPAHEHWEVWTPRQAGFGIYSLEKLASCVELPAISFQQPANEPEFARGYGRNDTMFEDLRLWSYRAIRQGWPNFDRWLEACIDRADGINARFPQPLPFSEVKATAKSVARWTHKRFDPASLQDLIDRTHTPELQSKRGKKSGRVRLEKSADKRAEARSMRDGGMSQRAIAVVLGAPRSTVQEWLK